MSHPSGIWINSPAARRLQPMRLNLVYRAQNKPASIADGFHLAEEDLRGLHVGLLLEAKTRYRAYATFFNEAAFAVDNRRGRQSGSGMLVWDWHCSEVP